MTDKTNENILLAKPYDVQVMEISILSLLDQIDAVEKSVSVIKELSDTIGAVPKNLEFYEYKISEEDQERINSLSSHIEDIEGKVSELESDLTSRDETITELNDTIQEKDVLLESLQAQWDEDKNKITSVSGDYESLQHTLSEALNKVKELEAKGEEAGRVITSLQTQQKESEESIESLNEQIVLLEGHCEESENKATTLENKVTKLQREGKKSKALADSLEQSNAQLALRLSRVNIKATKKETFEYSSLMLIVGLALKQKFIPMAKELCAKENTHEISEYIKETCGYPISHAEAESIHKAIKIEKIDIENLNDVGLTIIDKLLENQLRDEIELSNKGYFFSHELLAFVIPHYFVMRELTRFR